MESAYHVEDEEGLTSTSVSYSTAQPLRTQAEGNKKTISLQSGMLWCVLMTNTSSTDFEYLSLFWINSELTYLQNIFSFAESHFRHLVEKDILSKRYQMFGDFITNKVLVVCLTCIAYKTSP